MVDWTVRMNKGKWELLVAHPSGWCLLYSYQFKNCAIRAGYKAFPKGTFV